MKEDVLITIRGQQLIDGEDQGVVETISRGECRKRAGKYYVQYYESLVDGEPDVKSLMKLSPEEVAIRRKDAVKTELCFRLNLPKVTTYETPNGNFVITMRTTEFQYEESEAVIEVHLVYDLEIDGSVKQVSKVYIRVEDGEAAQVHLCDDAL